MSVDQLPSERHLRFHRRRWIIYLMGCTAMAIGTVAAALTPGENSEFALIPTGTLFALMIVMSLAERVRHREEYTREERRISEDEWVSRGFHRAQKTALMAVILVQVPMMFFMAYAPPDASAESSAFGMGSLTIALACAVMAASYLYHTREPADG